MTSYLKTKYGTKTFMLVLDRGMPSSENIEQMDQAELDYILGLKMNQRERQLILRAHEFDFADLAEKKGILSAVEVPVYENECLKKIVIFYDQKLATEQKKTRSERVR